MTAADRMIDRLTAAFERIAMFPETGERYQHPNSEFRIVTESPYLIFYKIAGDEIDIVVNFHLSRYSDILVGYSKLFGGSFLENTSGPTAAANAELFHLTFQQKW